LDSNHTKTTSESVKQFGADVALGWLGKAPNGDTAGT
jgi:hypothetical protein